MKNGEYPVKKIGISCRDCGKEMHFEAPTTRREAVTALLEAARAHDRACGGSLLWTEET